MAFRIVRLFCRQGDDVISDVAVKDQSGKTTQSVNGVAGGRPSVIAVSKGTVTASRATHVASTASSPAKHRFKRKPRILFSQAQVIEHHHRTSNHLFTMSFSPSLKHGRIS